MADKKGRGWKVALEVLGALVWVGASVVASQLVVGLFLTAVVDSKELGQPIWSAVYSALSYSIALGLVIGVPPRLKVAKKGGKPEYPGREELGLRGWPTWTDVGLAPVGFIAYLLLAAGVTALFSLFPWFDAEQAQDVGFNLLASGLDRAVAFLTLVIIAPIAEEVIFRGWLYGRLRKKIAGKMPDWVGMLLAIGLTSLAFGLIHMQWNVGANVFAMSIILCGLREITGTIYAGILLHILKNGVAFYLLYFVGVG